MGPRKTIFEKNSMFFTAFMLGDKNLWLVINGLSVWSLLVYTEVNEFVELIIFDLLRKMMGIDDIGIFLTLIVLCY